MSDNGKMVTFHISGIVNGQMRACDVQLTFIGDCDCGCLNATCGKEPCKTRVSVLEFFNSDEGKECVGVGFSMFGFEQDADNKAAFTLWLECGINKWEELKAAREEAKKN